MASIITSIGKKKFMALYSASRKYIAALHHKSPPIREKYGWKVFLEEVLDYQEAVLICTYESSHEKVIECFWESAYVRKYDTATRFPFRTILFLCLS